MDQNMKTNSSLLLSLCAAAAVLASELHAQIASEALSPTDDTVQFQSDTNALWLVAADTNALAESLAVLQERVAGAVLPEKPDAILLAATNRFLDNFEAGGVEAFWLRPDGRMSIGQFGVAPESGGMLQSLLVNNHLLNVNFADNNKSGLAAIGQSAGDYWNPYIKPGWYNWTIANLLWSDGITPSTADLTVTNAPGQWGSLFCLDPMYASYSYQEPGQGNIAVMLNQLPTDTYDFYVYATRASDNGAPVIQLKRAGVSLWTKGTTLWGNGWYSTYWDEHEQYVRFRNIAVNNQTITLEVYPDQVGYPSISGLQIVPSSAIPSEQPTITALLNVDLGGNGTPYKTGLAAVGLTTSDFWNACYHPGNRAASVPNLKWSNQSQSYAGMTVLNAAGSWGNSLPDPMFHTYSYATDGGNTTITLTNLPSGICNVYLYGHTTTLDDNAVFELWSDDVNWGTKGTSILGPGPTYATWEVGQQYVVFKDVTVTAGKPVIIHASHTKYGYNNLCGMQIAYTGAADTDADGLPDGWEQRCFNNLDQIATADIDADGLSNLREYQLGTDPTRTDSNANGISDLNDFERVWIEDATPQGGYQYSAGGDAWNWVSSWYDGSGWGGQVLYPHSGRSWDPRMHVSAKVLNALHEHYFNRSLAVIRPAVGDVIYAYVNLDPSFPPSEVMLQFYTVENNGLGSWDHRAYWGANTINLGVNGTASRYPMGALPTAGQWVRLEVPASVVGLEGKIIAGLRFTLYGGRAAWDSAGTMKPDHDGDELPDWWEMQYFGNLAQTADADPDADDLENIWEFRLGYNPTDPHTGGTTASDGDKDFDNDLLSNSAEISLYGSDPKDATSINDFVTDAEYFVTAQGGSENTAVRVDIYDYDPFWLFVITGAAPGAAYDVFIRPGVDPGTKWRRYYSGSPGQTELICPKPTGVMNFFKIGLASDRDVDGLTDGYECLVSQTGLNTIYFDLDGLPDGWEVEYGLDPRSATGDHGDNGNLDNDFRPPPNQAEPLVNLLEWNSGANGTDPKRNNSTEQQRPVITIAATDNIGMEPAGDPVTFTVTRTGSSSTAVDVYYTLGGEATHGADYSLMPNPTGSYPETFFVQVPSGGSSKTATITVTPVPDTAHESTERVIVALAPSPTDVYVVDPSKDRATASIRDRYAKTWTVNSDFDEGLLVGVNHVTTSDRLQLNGTLKGAANNNDTGQYRYVNVACSARGTVIRIDSETGKIVGEYRTSPDHTGGDPSRTTVDQYGNVWVANRAEATGGLGSITRIGLIQGTRYLAPGDPTPNENGLYVKIATAAYNTCIDRDGDGYIKTSRGVLDPEGNPAADVLAWSNYAGVDYGGGVSTAEDEAITEYVRVPGIGIRTIAVDRFNDVWVGAMGEEDRLGNVVKPHAHSKVDGCTAQSIANSAFSPSCNNGVAGGYGGVITPPDLDSPNGVLWSALSGGNTLRVIIPPNMPIGWNPDLKCVDMVDVLGVGYGIAVDPQSGEVWQTLHGTGELIRWHKDGDIYLNGSVARRYPSGAGSARGLVIDDNGHVWVAHSEGNDTVGHLNASKTLVGTVNLAGFDSNLDQRRRLSGIPPLPHHSPYGVSVDNNGKIWVANYGSDSAMRIDATWNGGLGGVDLAVDLDEGWPDVEANGAWPYNYSDMTGFNNHFVNPALVPLKGYWIVAHDGGTPGSEWEKVTWSEEEASLNGEIEVNVRAAETRAALYSQRFQPAINGAPLTGVKGRFIEVRGALVRDCNGLSPFLTDLTVFAHTPTLVIQGQPQDLLDVVEGDSATFSVVASGTDPLTYQWHFDGKPIDDATEASFKVPEAHYLQEGLFHVRITDAADSVLDSEAAFLKIDPRQITIMDGKSPWASRYPATIQSSWLPEEAAKVTAIVYDLASSHVVDVNLLLVGPNNNSVVLMSHAGGDTAVTDVSLTFDDTGPALYPPSANTLPGGTYKPGFYGQPFFPPGTPASTHSTLEAAFKGSDPNAIWSLYVCDDHAEQVSSPGAIVGSWTIRVSPPLAITAQPADQTVLEGGNAVFSVGAVGVEPLSYEWHGPAFAFGSESTFVVGPVNCERAGEYYVIVRDATGASVESSHALLTVGDGPKTILDLYKAAPYPAEYCVSGQPSSISKVTVTLNHFKHPQAKDVNILLVGPNDNTVTLMYHASQGQTPVDDLTITFDDSSPNTLPNASTEFPATGSQSYKPSGVLGVALPNPAPEPTHTTLGGAGGAFGGSNPNGVWKLYIYDDAEGPCLDHVAEIESWNLTFIP